VSAGAPRAGLSTPSDKRALRRQPGQSLLDRPGCEPAAEGDLAWSKAKTVQLGGGLRKQAVLAWIAGRGRRWQHIAAGTAAGVGGYLGQLGDVAELVGPAELALADRPGIRVGQRHQPVDDPLAALPLLDLGDDALAAVCQLLQPAGSPQLGLCAAPTCRGPCLGG
jgi:hypothetical protein